MYNAAVMAIEELLGATGRGWRHEEAYVCKT